MLNTMVIDQENLPRVAKLLGFVAPHLLPERFLLTPTWIIWTKGESPTAWTLPHVVFKDRYAIVGTQEDHMLCERIK
jgi:hypothetical protein